MRKGNVGATRVQTTSAWLRDTLQNRVLDLKRFYSQIVWYRKDLGDNIEKNDAATAKRLLLVYQVGSCALSPKAYVEERNIRKTFLHDARSICAHDPSLLKRLHLYFIDDLDDIEYAELDTSDRRIITSEILDAITEPAFEAGVDAPAVYVSGEAAVWGNLSWKRLLEEQATQKNVQEVLGRWQRPRVRGNKGTRSRGSKKG